jgi:cytochrome P450
VSGPSKRLGEFDPFDPQVVENPRDFFAALRREAPVYRLPNGAYFLISRYEDVRSAAMRPEIFSSNLVAVLMESGAGGGRPEIFELPTSGARAVDVLAIADAPQRADWVEQMAIPLPLTVIAELIGLPLEDTPRLKRWSDASVALLSGVNTKEQLAAHAAEVGALLRYLAERFDEARDVPGDNVLGDLVRATKDRDESLSRDEVVSILVQLLTAGNETTTSLIGSALMLMLRDSELQDRLRANPELVEPFIEEALRLESPFYGHFRVVRRDTEVAGVPLPARSRVMLLWASANRDDREFGNPDQIDLGRRNLRGHLSFGIGIHHCIGAPLARLETRVALETLLARTRTLRLAAENDLAHVPSLFVRSLKALHIEFEAA